MLASTCSMRLATLATVKFLSRLLTALNLLVDRNNRPREKVELAAQHDELRAGRADRRPAVAAEVGARLEVRHQAAGQPHQLDVALGSSSSRRLDWMRLR